MRKTTLFIVSFLLVAALLGAGVFAGLKAAPTRALAQSEQTPVPPPRTLNVTGNGKVYITPDIAYVSIGVHTEGSDAAEAVAANTAQSQEVADALTALRIDAKDIMTTNFSIFPQQQMDDQGKVTGILYVVDNTVYVTLRDIDLVGDVLNAAVEAGANSINSIQFDLADKTAALSEARKAAVADARTQAQELSEAAGVTLLEIQTINVYGSYVPMPVYDRGMGGAVMEAAVPVSAGQLVLSVDVNIVYNID